MRVDPSARARALLVEGLWLEASSRSLLRDLLHSRIDWDVLLRHARRASALPTLGWTLAHHALVEALPTDVARTLEDAVEQTAAQNALLVANVARLADAFARAGLSPLFVKGSALLLAHYPNPAARHTDDIDVHVPKEEVARARETLEALGYSTLMQVARDGARVRAGPARRSTYLAAGATPVDLHWGTPEDLWRRSEWRRVKGVAVRILGREDLFAQLCRHALGQHGADPRMLLRHMADARVMMDRADARGTGTIEQRATRMLVSASRSESGVQRATVARLILPEGRRARAWDAALLLRGLLRVMFGIRSAADLRHVLVPAESYLDATFGTESDSLPLRHLRRYARLLHRLTGLG